MGEYREARYRKVGAIHQARRRTERKGAFDDDTQARIYKGHRTHVYQVFRCFPYLLPIIDSGSHYNGDSTGL
jgi:hypothetical protein